MENKKNMSKLFLACIVMVSGTIFFSAWYIQETFTARKSVDISDYTVARQRLINDYGAQPIMLTTADGLSIAALTIVRPEASRIFIVCHGFKRSKEHMADFATLFPHDSFIFIDFRGQGQSGGQRISLGLHEHLDVMAAADYAKNNISSSLPLVGIGISQGGAAILRAAAYGAPFDALISDSAPSDFRYTVAQILQKSRWIPLPLGLAALSFYESTMGQSLCVSSYKKYAHLISCPVLLIHDRHDHLIDYTHAQKIFNALGSERKELLTVDNTIHGRMFKQAPEVYSKTIENFLS